MTLVVKVHGVQDCLNAFAELPRTVRNRHMRIGLSAAGGEIRSGMALMAPKESGLLRRSFKVKVKVPDASFNVAHHGKPAYAVVGASRNVVGVQTYRKSGALGKVKFARIQRKNKQDRWAGAMGMRVATTLRRPSRYFHLLERGTKGHAITAKASRTLAFNGIFRRSVQHPGITARAIASRSVQAFGTVAKMRMIGKLQDGIHSWASTRRVAATA